MELRKWDVHHQLELDAAKYRFYLHMCEKPMAQWQPWERVLVRALEDDPFITMMRIANHQEAKTKEEPHDSGDREAR